MDNQHFFLIKITRLPVSAILAGLFLYFNAFLSANAENVITSGTTFKVLSGTSVVSVENLVVKSGAILDNAGSLILKKNLTNENAPANSIGTGTAELSGTTAQTVSGQNVIANLSVNNTTGVIVGGNTKVNGTLTLTNGKVSLGANNLTLGPLADIVGTPSALVMIIVTGTGELRKEFPTGYTDTFTYPVGNDSGTAEYSPVTLNFTGGTFAVENYVGVSLKNEKYPDANIEGNYLNRYWTITQSGVTGFNCNAAFQYILADVTGTESKLSCTKVNPLPWVTYAITNSGTHVLTASGITTFSSFTGLKSTTTPANQELANINIPNGVTTCYDATQILTVAGNGNTFFVENNGSVTLVAGNRISVLAGMRVFSGGYLHAYITTNSTYCGSTFNPIVENPEEELLSIVQDPKSQWIKIYPNPTTDYFILELNQTDVSSITYVSIYNMNGKSILQQTMNGENKRQFSLSGQPVGIYMVHVRSNERSEIAKVVKN
ncbi:MAG: T9SS type A sorting domain-containing protein [Bacteroidales bacterium]|jgi:hypothetical protein|nr:T9SS type A sorting domain-containing protein [Bacteroidales bacterium]